MREDEPNSMATEPTENTEKTKIAELNSPQRRKGVKDAKSLCFY